MKNKTISQSRNSSTI